MKKPMKNPVNRNRVSKSDNLGELISKHPRTAQVLIDYGLHCVGCIASAVDTIEEGAKLHGMSDEEIDEIVGVINEILSPDQPA